jgi:mannan endo-1,4-beta-mannosidase
VSDGPGSSRGGAEGRRSGELLRGSGSFVELRDGQLWLEGELFRFLGTNCYFLQEEGARELLGWEGYAGRVDEALRKAAELGLKVVRAWAFNDDPDNPVAIQSEPGRLREAGLAGVDLAIERAAHHGVRLLLSLGNFWSDYGGVPQYLRWHGYGPDDSHRFFSEPTVVAHYAEHVEALLTRRNPRTGLTWGQDPAVLGWELMNEPRAGRATCGWVEALAPVVRRAAPCQLLCTGGEGRAEDDFAGALQSVDLASIHLYPEGWGWSQDRWIDEGADWIRAHADRAALAGRPLLLGEFGLSNRGLPLAERRAAYLRWLQVARRHPAVAGACSWSFSTDDRPDDWDEFTWGWRTGTVAEDPMNRYADLFAAEAPRWGA